MVSKARGKKEVGFGNFSILRFFALRGRFGCGSGRDRRCGQIGGCDIIIIIIIVIIIIIINY
jgi:hypothetical protein